MSETFVSKERSVKAVTCSSSISLSTSTRPILAAWQHRVVHCLGDHFGVSRGFGFVCYSSPTEAPQTIDQLNGSFIGSSKKPIFVAMAQRKEDRRRMLQAQRSRQRNIPYHTPHVHPMHSMHPMQPMYWAPYPAHPQVTNFISMRQIIKSVAGIPAAPTTQQSMPMGAHPIVHPLPHMRLPVHPIAPVDNTTHQPHTKPLRQRIIAHTNKQRIVALTPPWVRLHHLSNRKIKVQTKFKSLTRLRQKFWRLPHQVNACAGLATRNILSSPQLIKSRPERSPE